MDQDKFTLKRPCIGLGDNKILIYYFYYLNFKAKTPFESKTL